MTRRILLAEDNPADVYLIQRALKQHDVVCDMEVADNGRQALAMLRQYSQQAGKCRPSLILLDLNLPQHDGIEILQYIRQSGVLSKVPVVVLTSSDSPKDQMRSLSGGANLYLRKPSSLEEFMVIGEVLKGLLAQTSRVASYY